MKILVTGGAGFIGSHICDRLIKEGYEVCVIDNLSTGSLDNVKQHKNNTNFKFFNADIRDFEKVDKIFSSEKFDCVFHTAAQMNVRESVRDPQNDAGVNIIGILNLLEASRKNKVKKFIFSSSGGAIYGDTLNIPTPETSEIKPCSPYGIAKLCSEKYLYFYKKEYGLNYTALRYANVYGPRQNPKGEAGVIAVFINKILHDEQPVINGDGKQTRDYVFVEDVVNANFLALKENLEGEFNIGTGKETTVNEIFNELVKMSHKNIKEVHGVGAPGEQLRSCLSYGKIENACEWKPKVELDKGLVKTIEYFKNMRKGL